MIAHLVQSGLGAYYDGILHVLVTVEDAALVLGLALAAGTQGKPAARAVVLGLPIAWLVAGAATAFLAPAGERLPGWAMALSFGLVGALVAARARLSRSACTALAILLGALHGYSNGLEIEAEPVKGLLGITQSVFMLATLVAAFTSSLRAEWTLVAIRVLGSWIFATGLLMCGWELRG